MRVRYQTAPHPEISINADKIQKNNTRISIPPYCQAVWVPDGVHPESFDELKMNLAKGPHPEIGLQKYKF
ncbi:MAG: hypothetical protein ACX93O_04960 [Flagellimonas sp.]